jgi:farnesyl-diphosphate farnesyltransferase
MLTRLFAVHLGEPVFTPDRAKLHAGKRFGRGLQLTNIIKDHPVDLRDGRCFIPRESARRFDLAPNDLLQPHLPYPVRRWIVDRAMAHLEIALDYTLSIPPTAAGIRRFCLQPLMIAVLTLERVLSHPDITPDDRPKISRAEVADVMAFSRGYSSDDAAIRGWFESRPILGYGDVKRANAH